MEEQQLEAEAARYRQRATEFTQRAAVIRQNRNCDEWEARTVVFFEGRPAGAGGNRQRERERSR